MLKSIKTQWKRAVSALLAVVMAAGMLPAPALAAGTSAISPVPDTATIYAPTGSFELNVAGATAWNGGGQALIVYKAESGAAKNTTIRDAVPFALLEDNGGDRIKIGYVEDGPWTGSTLDATGWADKDNILVNLPDVIPSIAYDRDADKQFNSRLTRHEYVIAGTYALAEQLAQLQRSAMSSGDTLVVRQSAQTVSVSRAKGDPDHLHSYSLDGAVYQKYDAWTEYEDQEDSLSDLSYELPYSINRAFSADPSMTLTAFYPQAVSDASPVVIADNPTGGVGAYNPGSPGGQKPGTSNVAWATDPERTFLRFTLLEFPQGVVTDLNTTDYSTWHVVGTPLNVVWSKGGSGEAWSVDKCRSDITWYNSNAMQYNGKGSDAAQLMGGTVYSYDATSNPQWVTTADAFQAATGISDQEKEQMFHLNSSSWSTGWRDGDYTSMWGTDAESVTPGNLYKVYKANDAFIYLLGQLSAPDKGTGWSADEAIERWSEYVHDADGNLRTKYRIIVETGGIFKDPDGGRRAYTLREMMAYSLYNNEGNGQYTLIYDQSSTAVNMARWMRQGKDNQFLEYPLDENGTPTGEELHSTNGFKECDSYVNTITYSRAIRDSIFADRVSFGLHIFSPFNFESESELPDKPVLEVTKKVTTGISASEEFGFTVKYTAGAPSGFTATKNGADCTSQVTSTGDGLKFTLKADETIHIEFDADNSFRCEVTEDDSSNLTGITGTGGTADTTKFTTTSSVARATFTNGTTPPPEPDPDPDPTPGKSILFKRDANTNAGVGPATFKFSSVTNGDYEFDTDGTGTLETIQWWDPTEAAGKYIKPGEYAVSEIIPPPNYMPTAEVQQIKLELDEDGNPIPAGPLVFKNLAKVGLRIVKYDRLTHQPMQGVTFEIYRDGLSIGRYETKANGEILLTDIEPGTYRAVEVDTGDEGHILDSSYLEIELVAGEGIKDLIFFNDKKPGMKLIKVDSSDPSKTISGAKFSIRSVEGTYGPQEFTTNGNGEIDLSMLPEGAYEVTEVECAGYVIDNAQRIIHLKANDTVEFVFTNTKKPSFRLIKTSADGTPMDGVTFKITPIEDAAHSIDRTTQNGGEIYVEDLEPGVYSVVETATLPDHVLDTTEYHVELSPGKTAELRLTNVKRPYLTIAKVEKGSNTPIPGTTFTIEGINSDYRQDVTTGQDGTVTIQVDPGSYRVTEKSVPEPYVISDDPTQTISLNGGDEKKLIFENLKQPLLKITKIEKGTGVKIPGTVFLLEAIDGDYRQNVTTGADGSVELRVAPGSYRITEQSVPEPYVIGDEPTKTISLNPGDEKEVIFENLKKPLLTISKIDADTGEPIPGTVFTVKALDGDYQDDWTTGADGKVSQRVAPGTYQITEKSVPAPYYLPDKDADRVQTITLNPGDEKTVLFRNHKAPELTIYKEDSVAGAPIEGAKFHITFTSNGESAEAPASFDYGYLFTDANGEIRLHEQGQKLYPGEYTITEVEPAPGFQMKEPTTQTVIIHGGETKTVVFQNEPLNAIVVEKYDSVTHEALPGCTFQLRYLGGTSGTGGTIIGQKVTGKNGTCIWTGLTAGTYIVEEIDPADGYSIIQASETVYISDDGKQTVITVRFDNAPDGMLLIRKVCAVNPGTTLQDAEFKVTYADGTLIGDSNGIFVTDENGEIRITGLKPGKSVIVTETRAPAGFLIDTQSQTIQIKEGRTVSLTFKNQPLGSLIIQKRDSITGQPLPGAEFRVTTAAGCEVGLDGVIGDATLTQNGLFTTDSNGEIRISNLAPGALVITEVRAPDGYIMDSPSTNVVIGTNGDTQTVVITNTPKGGLLIRKIDSVTGKALPGVKFKITAANGELVPDNEGLTSSNGIYTTDENGQIYLQKLNPNTYVVTEVETLDGYLLDAMPQTVVVNGADTQVLTFTNMPLGGLLIKKMDSATKEPLADVIFKITRTDGTVVGNSNGEYRTDERGYISIPDLEPGSYLVREVQARTGYLLDDTVHAIEIKDHQTYTLEVFNQPLGNLIINKLSSADNSPLEGVKFQIKYANGQVVDNKNGQVSSNGIYYTDRNGQIILSGIIGTVVVTELETLPGYTIDPNTRTQTVVVNPNDTQTINFYNTPNTTFVIRKYIEGTDYEPLAGVCFKVTDGNGGAIGPDDGVYYTDHSGEIVLTGIEPGTTVIAREIKTVEGFVLDGTPQDILIKAGEVQRLTYWNKRAGTLVIEKRDSVTGALIPGAQFQLTYATGGYVDNDNGHLSSNGLYTTDANGEIRISSIIGTVVAKEVQAAPGYVINSSTQTQTVVVNPMDTQTLVFLNEPLCSLTLTKLDSVSGKPVPGVEFTVKDGSGNIVGRYVTGSDGTVVVTGLIPGNTYIVYESRVPDGYVLDPTPQYITVSNGTGNSWTSGGSSGTGTGTGNGSGNGLTFENDPTMTLTIHKYIAGTANEPLAGVAFKIVDGSGKPLNPDGGIYYTNSAGEIVLEGLEPGTTITAQEIKTVDGYVLDGNPQTIKIEAGKGQNLTFWNQPAGSLIIRKLDKLTGEPLAGVEFEAVYAEGGYVDTANGHLSSNGLYYTDDHGEIHISGIVGTIVVKETRPLPGYTIEPGREQQIVTVNPQETQTLTFYNIPANTLTIQKYIDGTDNEPLAGVEFLVTDSSGAVVGSSNGYYTTDKDGRISIPGLTPGTTITIRETKTVDGYVLDSTPQSILIKEGEAQTVTFWNKKAGGLIVNKIDAVTKEPLAGVKFRITYADGSNVDMDGGKISSNGIYTTDSTGQIKILGIVGTVIVEEIETIPGYIIDPNAKSQTVQINPNDTQTITFTNAPKQTLVIQKLVTGTKDQPLAGVEFLITDSSGAFVGPNNGIYRTDEYGRITITDLTPGTVITAKETKTLDGYVLDSTPQNIEIKSGEVQTLTFYNSPVGGLELIKVSESDKTRRIPNTTFEIRRMDGGLVETVTTDSAGRVHVDLDAGDYYAVEIEAAQGFKLDNTPHYFTVTDGKTTTVTITNKPFSGILIHKTDSVTGKGIYGVTFLLYDSTNTPIGQYTSDNSGYVYIENLTTSGRYYLRELENEGYVPDTQMKTVYVTAGQTTLIEWKNIPITAQIQITKKSADYNSTNGLPAGTLLEGAVFEIYDKANNLVDTIRSDSRGLAVSKPLPLGRYTIREVKAPDNTISSTRKDVKNE